MLAIALLASACSSMTEQERRAAREFEREHRMRRDAPNSLRSNVGQIYSNEHLPPVIDPRSE
jgi:hypothetical protein